MRWGETNTLHFVKLYLDKECLWNPDHESYKIKHKREKAYTEIITEFEALTGKCMTIPEVKIKIKNLRSTYTQQVQKIMQKSGPDSMYKPSLVWFHEMDRCLKFVPNGKASVNSSHDADEGDEADSSQAEWADEELPDNSFEDESSDPLVPFSHMDNQYESIIPENYLVQVKIEPDSSQGNSNQEMVQLKPQDTRHQGKRKRKKFKNSPESYSIPKRNVDTREDEFDIYGKYIASQLRKMNLQKALNIQIQIQNLVKEARMSASED